ncbi:MAG: Response regulator of zinc sigma-54-dependent two-component system [Desulfomicrobiaceae bacterium]|nr:Response regulator of zinc sigma-54-dependent two-component system [Desulfomicrobiaceae bacterium]
MDKARILVVEDDHAHGVMLEVMLSGWGYEVVRVEDGEAAVEQVRAEPFDAVLTDIRMARMDGITALHHIRAINPALPVLIMTAYSSVESAIQAVREGAYDYLQKPLDFEHLRLALARAVDHGRLKLENVRLREVVERASGEPELVGSSPAMRELFRTIDAVAPTEATVLITGESGTGKELVARAIHRASLRASGPLVTVNCAALPEQLLESELFGHEKGAFTGADRPRDGRFLKAHGGTLFLDEMGELPLTVQAKLLRAVQEGEVQRLGSDRVTQVDVRILAATNRDLAAEAAAGRFREDLYYRLSVITVAVPPLRARREDIVLLAHHFLQRYAERNHRAVRAFSPRAMDALLRHDWPGNVRELQNAVERAVILCPAETIDLEDLPASVRAAVERAPQEGAGSPGSLEDAERERILEVLRETGGNKSQAARILGITRVTLRAKMRRYGIEDEDRQAKSLAGLSQ